MRELEGIVEDLENGDIELEKSLALYKKGVGIIEVLENKLKEAKKQIEVLDSNGKEKSESE
jgi:exodeoxyribonuclease VII small subunit